jgi:hypothetical protein
VKSSALQLVGGKEKLFSEQVILLFHAAKTVTGYGMNGQFQKM